MPSIFTTNVVRVTAVLTLLLCAIMIGSIGENSGQSDGSPPNGHAWGHDDTPLPPGYAQKLGGDDKEEPPSPMRCKDTPIQQAFTMDLKGVAASLSAGTMLSLIVGNWDPLFGGNAGRVPGAALIENISVSVPTIPL
jgi:hypothetical protein